MTDKNTESRAAFEAWANGRCELHLVNPAGRYSSAITQFAWEAYQAGRAALQSQPLTVDALAQEIRRVDGDHSLGAGALAEALMPFLESALQSQDREDADRLDWLREETCDLRCINVPTGGDDYDVRWVVIQHHMSKPHEREIGRSFTDDPRDAIDHARRINKGGE